VKLIAAYLSIPLFVQLIKINSDSGTYVITSVQYTIKEAMFNFYLCLCLLMRDYSDTTDQIWTGWT